jgi:hypothetical protein
MRELEKIVKELLETARKLPSGEERQNTLKEIERFRLRLDAIAARSGKQQAEK